MCVATTASLTWVNSRCFGMRWFVRTCSPAADLVEVKYALAPKPRRQINSSADAADAFNWRERLLKIPGTDRRPVDAIGRFSRSGDARSRRRSSLPVDSDADKIISHLFDVARFIFDLVANRVRPLVVDPAAPRPIGNIGQRLNEITSALIFKTEEILAN